MACFEQTAKVHIKTYTRLGDEITINQGQENVRIFAAKNVGIEKGSQINAYLHSQEGIDIKNAEASKKTIINGLLIAAKIKSGSNVTLIGQPTDCSNTAPTGNKIDSLQANTESVENDQEELITPEPISQNVVYGPSPTTDFVNISLPNITKPTRAKVTISDNLGRQIKTQQAELSTAKNSIQIDLRKFYEGLYFIHIETNETKNTMKIQVLR